MSDLLTGNVLAERAAAALAVPLQKALDARLLVPSDPTAGQVFPSPAWPSTQVGRCTRVRWR